MQWSFFVPVSFCLVISHLVFPFASLNSPCSLNLLRFSSSSHSPTNTFSVGHRCNLLWTTILVLARIPQFITKLCSSCFLWFGWLFSNPYYKLNNSRLTGLNFHFILSSFLEYFINNNNRILGRWKVSFNQRKHDQEVALEWRIFVERLRTGWEAARMPHCSHTVQDGVLGSEWRLSTVVRLAHCSWEARVSSE